MRTAAYKVDVASDRRRRENVPRYILCSEKLQKIARNSKLWDMRVYYYENELEDEFNAFDSFAIQLAFEQAKLKKKKMYRVIREGNYTGFPGFYGVLMRHCNTLPLNSNFKTMEKFIAAVDRVLEKNQFVLVYPEQGMWWNYRKPRPLQKGAFTFAARNNKPVLPVFITMEDSDVLDDDGFYVQEYTVHFCEPIYPDPNKKRAQNSCEMRDKNYEAWKAVYEQTYGEKLTYSCDEEQPIKEKKAL